MAAVSATVYEPHELAEALRETHDLQGSLVHWAIAKLTRGCAVGLIFQTSIEVVHFHESDSRGAINTAHDCCVIARW
jgi:hypothetical protein